MTVDLLLYLHVIGATVLFGTGAGIAFFMVMSHQSREPALIAHVAGIVVVADLVFTATAAILQPITGYFLARAAGWPVFEGWLGLSLVLYVIVGAFWLPVVLFQMRMRDLARQASDAGEALPAAYFRLYRIWFAFGFPAFFSVLGILWLMLMKPAL
ncbi:MAG: DUF2269 domain-containing protein [Paracoccaceae bacterium]|nr:DUF2269 domain-containing protein [Paracoccaceae bacterium]